ncbi:hypothetical protein AO729_13210 [Pseudomonas sp. TTU2014-066ASC]|nr:hypothetical protein AO729_13210 [Pseudomonas sp. TTU2014-066ASC]
MGTITLDSWHGASRGRAALGAKLCMLTGTDDCIRVDSRAMKNTAFPCEEKRCLQFATSAGA